MVSIIRLPFTQSQPPRKTALEELNETSNLLELSLCGIGDNGIGWLGSNDGC
jgi:hypothetical protein